MAAKFVQLADRTWVSTNRIGTIKHTPDHHGWLLFDHSGIELGEAVPWFEPCDLDSTVVAAAPGETVTVVHCADTEHRPEATDVMHEQSRVVAWKVGDSRAAVFPLTCDDPHDNLLLYLSEQPDGRLLDFLGQVWFDSLDEALRAALKEAQENWDHRDEDGTERGATEPPVRMH